VVEKKILGEAERVFRAPLKGCMESSRRPDGAARSQPVGEKKKRIAWGRASVLDGNMCGWFRISGGSVRALAWESFTEEFGNHFLWGHGARKKTKTGFMHLLCARML
jgi:hypothetical protein